MRLRLLVAFVILSSVSSGLAYSGNKSKSPEVLAVEAVSDNAREADAAIAALRAHGRAGLDAFLAAHATELKKRQAEIAGGGGTADQAWEKLRTALDRVCQQRDCYASQ